MDEDLFATSTFFGFQVDGASLGSWSSVSGFGIRIAVEARESGGVGTGTAQLPGRFSYTNLRLSRPVCASTKDVMKWIATFARTAKASTAVISSRDAMGKIICTWSLDGVVPASWTGPSFDVNTQSLATETLELAYTGFLD